MINFLVLGDSFSNEIINFFNDSKYFILALCLVVSAYQIIQYIMADANQKSGHLKKVFIFIGGGLLAMILPSFINFFVRIFEI